MVKTWGTYICTEWYTTSLSHTFSYLRLCWSHHSSNAPSFFLEIYVSKVFLIQVTGSQTQDKCIFFLSFLSMPISLCISIFFPTSLHVPCLSIKQSQSEIFLKVASSSSFPKTKLISLALNLFALYSCHLLSIRVTYACMLGVEIDGDTIRFSPGWSKYQVATRNDVVK